MPHTAMELQTTEPAGRTREQPAPTSHEQPTATPTALTIITNTANINDVTQTLALQPLTTERLIVADGCVRSRS